ncbi:exported protein of unknown function [Candidatus Promineifilum breve]|uniref:DUF1349 domain-containing protein n=1 Tax=Candidatus Promineifilum breve TaxID=1806508 RepID=A0A160T347_9CHLR|nr:InlB B-repeat-containing protein [Candidatus Promineifilum breve]CUS03378.2 exported protein of unknown function [Candidatus Promineifilum breve]
MREKSQLRSVLILCLALIATLLPAATRPTAADTNAFSLTTQVSPPGSGTVNVNPGPPYTQNQVVTLSATANAGFVFDKWILDDGGKWWNGGWDYRVEVTAGAAGTARKNKPAEFPLNFTTLWSSLSTTGTLDPNSIRVVEVDGSDNVIDADVPFQFDKATDFNPANKAAGTLVLIMEGNTAAGATRRYHVYFDVTGKGFTPPVVPAQVTLTETPDEGIASYKVQNATGTIFVHKVSGGVSSYNDVDGDDWVTWSTAAGAAGAFRGIPNATGGNNDGVFHPGPGQMTNPTLSTGPIKATLHFLGKNVQGDTSRWEGTFEIYPDYVIFTMLATKISPAKAYPFWFLYEGTPGGHLDPNVDFVMRSNGIQTLAGQTWDGDLPDEEWVYVADPTSGADGRAIYLINHTDDTKHDTYFTDTGKVMTILGFGRQGSSILLESATVPRELIFGLMDETLIDDAKPIIYNADRALNVNVGAAKSRAGASLGTNPTVQFTITGEHTIIAQFKPTTYTVNVTISPANTGTVTKTPNKASYNHGELVTLAAAPTAAGYSFAGWDGDVTGTTNPVTVPVTKNMEVTALFAQSFTVTASANPGAGGVVTLSPPGPTYAPGAQVTATATANSGYTFTNWSGGLSGNEPVKTFTVSGNMNIVAHFDQAQFTFNATAGAGGSVTWSPLKDLYAAGEIVTVTAAPDDGYAFQGWTGDITSNVNPLEWTITGNTTVQANFVATQTYALNVTIPSGGGTVTADPPNVGEYPAGTVVTLTAVPDTDKVFLGWSGDASGSNLTAQVTMSADRNVTATFGEDAYPLNVTVNPPAGGTVSKQPNQALYAPGTVVTLTASANQGWTFTGWSGDASGTNPTTTVTVPVGGADVTASFTAPGPFTLNIAANLGNGDGTVTVEPEKDEYAFGEVVTLTATPDEGSVFTGWAGDLSGATNPVNVTMDDDKTIAATFIVPAGPFSDNFNTCQLAPHWSEIDPLGDGTFALNGRQLLITAPEGDNHNVWSDGINAPRVMQDADNVNFEYVVKFDSLVTANAQMQGIIIEQDAQNFARFDFEYNYTGSSTDLVKAYAATITAGAAKKRISVDIPVASAVYLRVARAGTTWRMSYSANGIDWIDADPPIKNYTLNVTSVGPFAGNVGIQNNPAPAHTAIVDFFHNTADGPLPADAPLLNITTIGGGAVTTNPPVAQVACGQTVTLTATPGVGFTFGGWSGGLTGTQTTASLLVNGPTDVTATFVALDKQFVMLPMIVNQP